MVRYILSLTLGCLYSLQCIGNELPTNQFPNSPTANLIDSITNSAGEGHIFVVYDGCFKEASESQDSEMEQKFDYTENLEGLNLILIGPNAQFTSTDFSASTDGLNQLLDSEYERPQFKPSSEYEAESDVTNSLFLADTYISRADNYGYLLTSSFPYEIGSIDLANGGIGFINGINNDLEIAKEHAIRISQYAKGAKIYGIYNATHSTLLDILECILGHCRIYSPPVQMLKKQWEQFIANHGPEAKFFQICHSSGCISVFNALASSPKEIRERTIVLAICPGAIIPPKMCFEAYNYASKRDIVPHLDAIGKILYGDSLILLEPHPDAFHFDHRFDSPTFQNSILYHIISYLKQIGHI